MTEKITLPRDVAEAIEELKSIGLTPFIIAQKIGVKQGIGATGLNPLLITIDEWRLVDAGKRNQEILSALVNGYTIEQSPEEKLRGVYSAHKKNAEITGGYGRGLHAGYVDGIETTLSILGIQIEGINVGGGS